MSSIQKSNKTTKKSNQSKSSSSSSNIAAAAGVVGVDVSVPPNPRVDAMIQKLQKAMMKCQQTQRQPQQRRNVAGSSSSSSTSSSSSSSSSPSLPALLNHLRHCLTILHAKTTSLERALHCLLHEIWPQFVAAVIDHSSQLLFVCNTTVRNKNTNSNQTHKTKTKTNNNNNSCSSSSIQTLAYHFFMQLLRLHDGHILCESGECRHDGDVHMTRQYYAKALGFVSQLNNNNNNSNTSTTTMATTATTDATDTGTTSEQTQSRLYRLHAVYSGASWDELMNESVGIWHRLQQQQQQHYYSRRSDDDLDWEDFIDERVPELNAFMNEIEHVKTCNQRSFAALMERINLGRDVTQALLLVQQQQQQQQQPSSKGSRSVSITMRVNLRDKMEEFSLCIKNSGSIGKDIAVTLQRRASAFQWNDPQGVLPINFNARDWSQSLALPVLQRTSSSSSSQAQPQPAAATASAAAAVASSSSSALVLAQNKYKKRRRRVILDDDDGDDSSKSDDDRDERHLVKKSTYGGGKPEGDAALLEKENSNKKKKQSKPSKRSSTIQNFGQSAIAGAIHPATAVVGEAGGTGLLVKVDAPTRDTAASSMDSGRNNSSNNTTSLMEIKKQSGVNVEALEAASLVVQAEEAETKRQAMAVDLMILDHHDNDKSHINIHHDDIAMLDGDDEDDDDAAEVLVARQQAKLKVKHFRAQLKKILRKHSNKMTTSTFTMKAAAEDAAQDYHPPEYEVWDVRENLRLALMDAGNQYLFDETTETNSSIKSKHNKTARQQDQRHECLQRAMEYFIGAAECVVEQQALFAKMMANDNDDDNARVGPNLFFLHAQALTNQGITFLEQAKHLQTVFKKQQKQDGAADGKTERHYLRNAIQTLESSLLQLQKFKTQSDMYYAKTMQAGEEQEAAIFDFFQAQELESLTHRTIACAFWQEGLFTQALERFRIAGSLLAHEENGPTANAMDVDNPVQKQQLQLLDEMEIERRTQFSSREVLEAELLVRIECFYAWTRLADLGNTFLEQSYNNSMRHRRRLTDCDQAKTRKKDEEMYNTVQDALRRALSASKTIHEKVIKHAPPFVAEHLKKVVSDRDVQTPQELEKFLAESPEWWRICQEEMSGAVQPLIQSNVEQQKLPRNDVDAKLPVDSFENEHEPPKRRFAFTFNGTPRHKKKKKKKRNDHVGSGVGFFTTETQPPTTVAQKQQNFRPWGDELLPQVLDEISGQMVPKLPAVCMPPIMPPEIAAILQRQRQS